MTTYAAGIMDGNREWARFTIPGQPIGKPRMTQSDKWNRRDVVIAYRAWADLARIAAGRLVAHVAGGRPGCVKAIAYFEMPSSWSEAKRKAHAGQPHRVKPDVDNVLKALMDALIANDQVVHTVTVLKRWDDGTGARLVVVIET